MQGIISEALKQTLMDCQISCTSPLPWVWVIEALSRSNQVDLLVLLDLLEKTPEIPNDLGKNAREMVSLRILESFSVKGDCADSVSSPRSVKIRLDPSESCEDALRRILSKTSVANLKDAVPEMWKWDIQPFLKHKRSKLGKSALQQLKDAILTGSHSFLASLKERSGLSVGNQPEHGAPVKDVNGSDVTPTVEGRDANGSYLLDGDPPVDKLQPVSRKRKITTENSSGESCKQQILLKDGCKTPMKFVSKSKHDNVGRGQVGGKLLSSGVDTLLADNNECTSSKGLVDPPEVLPGAKEVPHCDTEVSNTSEEETEDCDIEKAKTVKEGFRESEPVNEGVDNFEQTNNQRDVPNIGEMEDEDDIDNMTDDAAKNNASFGCDPTRRLDTSDAPNLGNLDLLADASRRVVQHSDEERCGLGETTHEGSPRRNERPDDGNNKCISLKGVVHHDEVLPNGFENVVGGEKGLFTETLENMDELEPNILRNVPNVVQGGEDINVGSDSYSDGYHEERSIIDAKKKKFMSSQCTYSQESLAMSDWIELNLCMKCDKGGKLLICSSNACQIVIHESCLGSKPSFNTDGKFYCPFCAYSRAISEYMKVRKKSNLARKDLATFICSENRKESKKHSRKSCDEPNKRDFSKGDSSRQCRKRLEFEEAGPSTLHSGYSSPCRGRTVDLTDKDRKEGKRTRQVSRSPRVHVKHQKAAKIIRKSQGDVHEKNAEIRSKKGVLFPEKRKLHRESKCSPSIKSVDAEELSEVKEIHISKYFTRVKKETKYTYPAIPNLRRTNLPWTREEVEKLKEAVKKVWSPHDKVIPWTTILEFGAGTFDKSRSTIDLKDKWRNLCKTMK